MDYIRTILENVKKYADHAILADDNIPNGLTYK